MEYIFPDHWSFLLGEIALYSFVILVVTGVFLALFFDPSTALVTYHGSYAPLQGMSISADYNSTLNLSFNVSGGLLMRQTHHWAALVFVAAITIHLMRIIFTGAFRKPREINYVIGLTLLVLSILEGFMGYSLGGDLLSGIGLAIAWGVAMSIPFIGGALASALWDGRFPGSTAFESRLYILHVFVIPGAIATLLAAHLAIIMIQRHSQFPGPGRRERNVVGTPMWPGYALRSIGLFAAVGAVLVLMGGLIQINPVWLWGPYHVYTATNGAQPDWYLGWLIGTLRLMPSLDIHLFGRTIVPDPFWGGVLYPGIIFTLLYSLPWLDRRFFSEGDRARHDLLDRPRDNPRRTATGVAVLSSVLTVFVAGSADRLYFTFGFDYETLIWIFRGAFFVVPVLVYVVAKRTCEALKRTEAHPLRGWSGRAVRRTDSGGYEVVSPAPPKSPGGDPRHTG